jgi:hypothetical protein
MVLTVMRLDHVTTLLTSIFLILRPKHLAKGALFSSSSSQDVNKFLLLWALM